MILAITHQVPSWLMAHIAEPAIRSLILAGLAGLALGVFRPKSLPIQMAIWTTALYAALAMPFLGWILPAVRVPLPAFGRINLVRAAAHVRSYRSAVFVGPDAVTAGTASSRDAVAARLGAFSRRAVQISAQPAPLPVSRRGSALRELFTSDGPAMAAGLYFLAVGILFARFLLGVILRRRLRQNCVSVDDRRARALLERSAQSLEIANLPVLAESKAVMVPVTLGVRNPAILLPCDWREWEDAKLGAVLAHELWHVKRRDARTQGLSAIHCSVFWFSPLSWWLDRKIAELAEEASDQAALRAGAEASYYSQVLLNFFAAFGASGRRVQWEAISLVHGSQPERRINRILGANTRLQSSLRRPVLALLIACALPGVCLMAIMRPSMMRAQAASPAPGAAVAEPLQQAPLPHPNVAPHPMRLKAVPPVPPAPATPNPQRARTVFPGGHGVPPSAPIAPPSPSEPTPAASALAALPGLPVPPEGPQPPPGAQSTSSPSQNGSTSWSYYGNGGPDYAIVSGTSVLMSGSQGEHEEVESLRRKINGDFIWFRRDGKSYIVKDAAFVRQAAQLFAPERELGKQQAALGEQQEALGRQQAALGRQMRGIRVQVPRDLATQIERVETAIKEIGPNGNQQQLGRLQGELGRIQGELGRLQGQAGTQDGAIGRQMGALGRRQGMLGREQGRLGREQARLAREANREMTRLIDSALARGLAKPARVTQ
jgi:beta-lactamase regulating signal transducer with metallopeptidase domain